MIIRSFLFWILLAALLWLDSTLPLSDVPHTGAFLGALFTAIGVALGWLADKAVTIATVLWHVAVFVGKALWDVAVQIARVFKALYGFLGKFWNSILKPLVKWVWQTYQRLRKWLEDTLGPVLKFLYTVRCELLKFYDKWLRPVLETITVIRRTLQLLAALRIEWARDLDRKLADLEDRLLAPVQFLLRKVNQVIDVVNRVVTLDGLLQRVVLLQSIARDIVGVANTWHQAFSRPVTAGEREAALAQNPHKTGAQLAREFVAYLETGQGPHAASIAEWGAEFDRRMRDAA